MPGRPPRSSPRWSASEPSGASWSLRSPRPTGAAARRTRWRSRRARPAAGTWSAPRRLPSTLFLRRATTKRGSGWPRRWCGCGTSAAERGSTSTRSAPPRRRWRTSAASSTRTCTTSCSTSTIWRSTCSSNLERPLNDAEFRGKSQKPAVRRDFLLQNVAAPPQIACAAVPNGTLGDASDFEKVRHNGRRLDRAAPRGLRAWSLSHLGAFPAASSSRRASASGRGPRSSTSTSATRSTASSRRRGTTWRGWRSWRSGGSRRRRARGLSCFASRVHE